eukprot:447158-Hanusia_phi.AAC.1
MLPDTPGCSRILPDAPGYSRILPDTQDMNGQETAGMKSEGAEDKGKKNKGACGRNRVCQKTVEPADTEGRRAKGEMRFLWKAMIGLGNRILGNR